MGQELFLILSILAAYLIIILFIGSYSYKRSLSTMEDYHMAGREFNTFLLFTAIFGTNISAVALVGAPGNAYHVGWITWPYFVTSWGWLTPILFYTVGNRAWALGKRLGHMTMSDVIGDRWKSKGLSYLIAAISLFYTIPYVMVGAMGGGQTLDGVTGGAVPYWLGALIFTLMVCFYVALGGMRGTAWTNAFQTIVFLIGGVMIFFVVANALGGPAKITSVIMEKYPELLTREKMPWKVFFSYGFIVSMAVPMFPQVFIRLLTGKSQGSLKKMSLIYPVAAIIIWFIVAYVGMWGHTAFPNLAGPDSQQIIPLFLREYSSVWMMGILSAAIFAAAMSSMDAQLLTVGTIFVKDILYRAKSDSQVIEGREVIVSRILIIVLAAIAYILSLLKPMGIIQIVNWAFAGFAVLMVPMLGALYWRRCTKQAAFVSIILS